MKKRICLNMIVKNESAVIERCLASLRDHIDAWVIVDTGSTDDTKEKIRKSLEGIPGALHERPWRNFGSNRSEAVALAYESGCDYFLFFDADDVLLAPEGFTWPKLDAHVYELTLVYGNYRYARASLVSSKLHWRWVGVLHEYADSTPMATSRGTLPQPQIRASTEGARSGDPQKYHRDAEALEQGLRDEPDNLRYLFYLAQSYRDAGRPAEALPVYERRAAAGGWEEESWRSLLEAARLRERLAQPAEEVHRAYLKAFEARPTRAEPLVELARMMRGLSRTPLAYLYAKHAASIAQPSDRLFVEADVYQWRALDELSIAAYWTNRFAESDAICTQLLNSGLLPAEHVERVTANQNFSRSKLAG
jgi:tetratricopeptide (TPR) repeat protein